MNYKRLSQKMHLKTLRLFYNPHIPEDFYLYSLAALVGILAGLGAFLLNKLIDFFHHSFFVELLSLTHSSFLNTVVLILIPAIGGLIVGILVHLFAKEAAGHGVPGVIEAISDKEGIIKPRLSILTIFTSGTLIGTGGSAGKEGPIIQIGAAFGSAVGQFFKVSHSRMRILVGCGAGAGLAAVYNAPITGVLFALEVLLKDFSIGAFSPIIISTIIATTLTHYLVGSSPLFGVPAYHLQSPWEYFMYMGMGIIGGIISVFFIRFLYKSEDWFEEIKIPVWLKPALGGVIVGIIALKFPEIYGWDDEAIFTALTGRTGILILLALMMVKIVGTTSSLASGGTGGLFTPSLFIGATYGAAYGLLMNYLFPGISATPGAYALVGMGIMIAGTTHATLSAMLLIFEITRDYAIILPLMLGVILATIVARKLESESIYTFKLRLTGDHWVTGRKKEILQSIPVRDILNRDFDYLNVRDRLGSIWNKFKYSHMDTFAVLDDHNHFHGVVSLRDIKTALFESDLNELVIAKDIANDKVFTISENATLYDAYNMFELSDYDILVVMATHDPKKLVGVISREDIKRIYRQQYLNRI